MVWWHLSSHGYSWSFYHSKCQNNVKYHTHHKQETLWKYEYMYFEQVFWLIWKKKKGLQRFRMITLMVALLKDPLLIILLISYGYRFSDLLMHLPPQHTCAAIAKPYYLWGCDVTMQRWMMSNWHFPQNLTWQLEL